MALRRIIVLIAVATASYWSVSPLNSAESYIWGVQIASRRSEAEAQTSYNELFRRFYSVLGDREAFIFTSSVLGEESYRVRVKAGSLEEANEFCRRYKVAGGICFAIKTQNTYNSIKSISYRGNVSSEQVNDNLPNAKVILIFNEGDRYTGDLLGGLPHGRGILETAEGDRFEGEFRNGRPHGGGELLTAEGFRYEGTWEAGKEVDVRRVGARDSLPSSKQPLDSKTVRLPETNVPFPMSKPSEEPSDGGRQLDFAASFHQRIGMVNTGAIVRLQDRLNWLGYQAGEQDGKIGPKSWDAIVAYASDHTLALDRMDASNFLNHVLGQATETVSRFRQSQQSDCKAWSDTAHASLKIEWSGACTNGYAEGYGVLRQEFVLRGNRAWKQFTGVMKGGRYSGLGELSWHGAVPANSKRYVGDFLDGKFDGTGEIVYNDGRRYSGEWKQGVYQGEGVYSSPGFGRVEAMFVRGLPNGPGKHFDAKGILQLTGVFKNGCLKVGKKWVYIITTREKCGY